MTLMLAGLALAGCSSSFAVEYPPVAEQMATNWSVRAVEVVVPAGLKVDSSNAILPNADIVWYGGGPGDRRAQVAAILQNGIARGAEGLHGPIPVIFDVELVRFHALTPNAYTRAPVGTGVHGIVFQIAVRDAHTGEVLLGPDRIRADMPAKVAAEEPGYDIRSYTDREEVAITTQLAAVIRGWLGIGPDIRTGFSRIGR